MSVNHTEKEEHRQPGSEPWYRPLDKATASQYQDLLPGQSSKHRTKRIRALSPGEVISLVPQEVESGRYLVYKERGETLAVLLKRFRNEQNIALTVPITYAGRLDPMAEGIALLLVGDARYQKDEYLKFGKTYEVEVVLGVTTDTQDMLGLITQEDYRPHLKERIVQTLASLTEVTELLYPPYSSVLVEGKPLFVHARAGTDVLIPSKRVHIESATLLHIRTVAMEALAREAIVDIGKVEGDFRQLAIMKQWQSALRTHKNHIATVVTIRVTASSGTYMRSIAAWIGEQLGVPALAYKIKRTKIGEYTI